jgi:Peptidyl-tRNA hydrolase
MAANRHNIGFMALDVIATRHGFSPWRRRFKGVTAEGSIAGTKILPARHPSGSQSPPAKAWASLWGSDPSLTVKAWSVRNRKFKALIQTRFSQPRSPI